MNCLNCHHTKVNINAVEDAGETDHKHFTGARVATSENGWISPVGVFYACTSVEHDKSAAYLLHTHRANIEHRLREAHNNDVIDQLDSLPARSILIAAGFALLSKGLLAESNLPDDITRKQLELMQRSNLKFEPKSGRLNPEVYLEYRKKLIEDAKVDPLLDSLGYESRVELAAFIDNPSSFLRLSTDYDSDLDINEVYDALTIGFTGEHVEGQAINHGNQYTWRKLPLPSGAVLYVQLGDHEHDAMPDYNGEHEYGISLVTIEDIKAFLKTDRLPQLE